MSDNRNTFFVSEEEQAHISRCREMLKKHPGIVQLMGRNPYTFVILICLLALQLSIAWWMSSLGWSYWWLMILLAYTVGAVANQCFYVGIHEGTHNLIFKNRLLNRWVVLMCDLCNIIPGGMGFRTYHLKHHAHLGEYDIDTDLASPWEARLVGNSTIKKAVWLALFPVFQVIRTFRVKKVNTWNKWVIINIITGFTFDALVVIFLGWPALVYLLASMLFTLGLHPLGARWIQEHFTLVENQETYSYYGPLNYLTMNIGYHNEHHDFPSIPWNNLPALRKMAPEYYDTLIHHNSWTKLLKEFIFNPEYSLYSRVIRTKGADEGKVSGKTISAGMA